LGPEKVQIPRKRIKIDIRRVCQNKTQTYV